MIYKANFVSKLSHVFQPIKPNQTKRLQRFKAELSSSTLFPSLFLLSVFLHPSSLPSSGTSRSFLVLFMWKKSQMGTLWSPHATSPPCEKQQKLKIESMPFVLLITCCHIWKIWWNCLMISTETVLQWSNFPHMVKMYRLAHSPRCLLNDYRENIPHSAFEYKHVFIIVIFIAARWGLLLWICSARVPFLISFFFFYKNSEGKSARKPVPNQCRCEPAVFI